RLRLRINQLVPGSALHFHFALCIFHFLFFNPSPNRSPSPHHEETTACPAAVAHSAEEADLILHHGKVVTVDRDFSVREALAIRDGKILKVGTNEDVL